MTFPYKIDVIYTQDSKKTKMHTTFAHSVPLIFMFLFMLCMVQGTTKML